MQSTSLKCWSGWITSWNQDCHQKYQQSQIYRWYDSKGRNQRGTKEPLGKYERGKWKSLLKTQHSKNEDHGIWSHNSMADRWQKSGNKFFLGSKITTDGDYSHKNKRCLLLGRKAMTNLDSVFKKQRHYFANKGLSSQSYHISSSHVWMWDLDYKESWAPKNWWIFGWFVVYLIEANYFTILWWFLPYIDMNQPCVYMCPSSWTPLPPPSLSHPSGLSQCTSFECPVSCIKLGLVIYFTYGNIHVSILFSQIMPSSPSPTE